MRNGTSLFDLLRPSPLVSPVTAYFSRLGKSAYHPFALPHFKMNPANPIVGTGLGECAPSGVQRRTDVERSFVLLDSVRIRRNLPHRDRLRLRCQRESLTIPTPGVGADRSAYKAEVLMGHKTSPADGHAVALSCWYAAAVCTSFHSIPALPAPAPRTES